MSEKKEQSLTSDEDKESIENDTLKSKDIENSDEVLETNSNNEELSTEDINKELEAKIEDLRDQLMRTLADSENLRKRTLKEIEHSKKYSHISFVRDLVSLFDNLQRALDAVPDDKSKLSEPIKNLIVGLELVNKEIINTFEKHNLKQIEPLGEKFDYNLHQAMYEVPTNDEETGIVVEVSQKGYLLYDRLVRPAMVGISKKIEDEKNNNGKTKKI
ncbi:nucleotide exchange factor GrpE [Alphaproteobacteria bacterium]|nr:nucleotide exchange factor GrpE [Alphaproteobacteria bacterium]